MACHANSNRVWHLFLLMVIAGCSSRAVALPSDQGSASQAYEACASEQCLLIDFLLHRNSKENSWSAATEAFNGTERWRSLEPVVSGASLCEWIPSTGCFERVLTVRQSVQPPGPGGELTGCVVVAGIRPGQGFKSYGVAYASEGGRWVVTGVGYYVSLEDSPTLEDMLVDPCPRE